MVDTMTQRFASLSEFAKDAALALALSIFGCFGLVLRPDFFMGGGGAHRPGAHDQHFTFDTSATVRAQSPTPFGPLGTPSPWAYVVTIAAFLPLAFRRRFPLTVLALTTIAAVIYEVGHFPPTIAFVAPLIAVYTVASVRDRRVVILAGALSALAQLGAAWVAVGTSGLLAEFVRIIAMTGAAGALGEATRNRRAYVAEVEQRAAEAERTRDEEARRRVDEERLRIARELHDITAHSLSIIAVQSGAAAHVIGTDPDEARRSLEAIRRTSREALDELRAMLGVLRATGDSDAPFAPAPGLARLSELVVPLAEAGYNVTTHIDEDLGEIPAVVEGSAYRIVQEALTNIVRHAGRCNVWLHVGRENGSLSISVENDGTTPSLPLPEGGHGLQGMGERVMALGGTFIAEPREGGGFRIAARLPIARSS